MEFGSFMEFHRRQGASQADAFEEGLRQVDLAEALGLDSVWMSESHFNAERSVMSSPMIVASAIAGRTKRLKVGTAVQVLPLTNPLRVAEESATLDHVAQGRFEFGIGRSGLPGAYEGYNIPYAESRERFFEALEVIKKAWTNERFSHEGKYWSFYDVCLVPKPYQSPHPPLRIASTTSDSFPVIGRLGIPLFVGLRSASMPQVSQQVGAYKKAYEDAGYQGPVNVYVRVPVYVAETREEALALPEESFMRQFRRLGSQLARSAAAVGTRPTEERAERSQQLATLNWEQVQREKVAVGTPEMVVERIHEMKEALHLSGVVGEFNAGELIPRDRLENSLRLFCEKVIPAFR